MKQLIVMLTILLATNITYGQTDTWGKSDRDNVYNDCMSYLGSNHKHLSNEQKETISLCFLDKTTSQYTKTNYQAKIEIELKRLRSATVGECAKTHGIELNAPVEATTPAKPTIDGPTKENLVGHWKEKSEDREFELSSMGTFTMVYVGKRSTGKWQLDGMKLTLFFDRLFGSKERVYDIEIFKEDNFGYTSSKGTFYNVVRVK